MSGCDEKANTEEKVKVVSCNGEGDNTNYIEHPKIYLTVKVGKEVVCPYCSKVFTF
ncbi:zinc-finger domain-containing protein [Ehrlichia sp. JZT12]